MNAFFPYTVEDSESIVVPNLEDSHRVLYVVWGEQYEIEAERSINSLLRHNSEVEIDLISSKSFADRFKKAEWRGEPGTSFGNPYVTKVDAIASMVREYGYADKVVYLDTDTYICRPIDDLFAVINYADIAMAHAPHYVTDKRKFERPDAMPDFNTGVIAFSPIEAEDVMDMWRDAIENESYTNDQGPMAELMYFVFPERTRFVVLPTEFNARTSWPFYVNKPVSILHGRGESLDQAINAFDKDNRGGARVWLPSQGRVLR